MRKKWVGTAAKIARARRKEGKLKPLYIVDALRKGRELVFIIMVFFIVGMRLWLDWTAPTCRWERT